MSYRLRKGIQQIINDPSQLMHALYKQILDWTQPFGIKDFCDNYNFFQCAACDDARLDSRPLLYYNDPTHVVYTLSKKGVVNLLIHLHLKYLRTLFIYYNWDVQI